METIYIECGNQMLQKTLDQVVEYAEALYGDRNGTYKIIISETKTNSLSPHIEIYIDGTVEVFITNNAYEQLGVSGPFMILNQMAHEVIHSLMPHAQGEANYLEEGMAVYFSLKVLKDFLSITDEEIEQILVSLKQNYINYYNSYQLVVLSDIVNKVKAIRKIQPDLSKLKITDIEHLDIDKLIKKNLLKNYKEPL